MITLFSNKDHPATGKITKG